MEEILVWLTPILSGGLGLVTAAIIFLGRMRNYSKTMKMLNGTVENWDYNKFLASMKTNLQKMYDKEKDMEKQIIDLNLKISYLVEEGKKNAKKVDTQKTNQAVKK